MKVAIIGSRSVQVQNFDDYIPKDCTEIVSGGAAGVDRCAAAYAAAHGLPLTEFLPQYDRYGRGAPIVRNKQIVDYADTVLAFWDGVSRGTLSVINYCEQTGTPCRVIRLPV